MGWKGIHVLKARVSMVRREVGEGLIPLWKKLLALGQSQAPAWAWPPLGVAPGCTLAALAPHNRNTAPLKC